MDIVAILALVAKGISVAEALYTTGQEAAPAFNALKDLVTGAQKGTATDVDLAKTEALLDSMIDDFNIDLPDPPPTT